MPGSAGPSRADRVVAAGFVAASLGETVALHRDTPGLLVLGVCGAPLLGVLAVRRTHPLTPILVIATFAALGTTIQTIRWPDSGDGGGVWLVALLFSAYSLGAHGRGRTLVLGALLPLLVGLAIDGPTMTGWALVNGLTFLTMFVGLLPTAVGRVVRVRRDRLAVLDAQRRQLVRDRQAQREAAVLEERLRTTRRLQPVLLDGLRALAEGADHGADPGEVERAARGLLGRARDEVLALTAPVEVPEPALPSPTVDHLGPLRDGAQPWVVLAAGVIGAGLALESVGALVLSTPSWVAVVAGPLVCLPLALLARRPLAAAALTWVGAVAFSRLVAPLDGTLSGTALTLVLAFAVAALAARRAALVGLVLCWGGQLVGVGTGDPLGEAVIILICWLGGLAVNEVGALVEQSRDNTRRLVGRESAARERAAAEERVRLAREIHDQIGHSLTVVALQAGAARRLAATDPDRMRRVMATIAAAARDGLTALTGDAPGDLVALLEQTRDAGMSITTDAVDADALRLVDDETREVAYRIVQEALTNALRHAPGASVTVTIGPEGRELVVAVRNGRATRPGSVSGSRQGLVGLQERVVAHDGDLCWGPREDGGFEVRATIPARRVERAFR